MSLLFFFTFLLLNFSTSIANDSSMIEDYIRNFTRTKQSVNVTYQICGQGLNDVNSNDLQVKLTRDHKLPKLLHNGFYKHQDICNDIKKSNKKLGIIFEKAHVCDAGGRVCLHLLRTAIDPCNKFIHDNFATFHTRPFDCPYEKDSKNICEARAEADNIDSEWDSTDGPKIIVLQVNTDGTCSEIKRQHVGLIAIGDDPDKRIADLRKELTSNKAIRENLLNNDRTSCDRSIYPDPDLKSVYHAAKEQSKNY